MRIDWGVLATGLLIAVIGTAMARAQHPESQARALGSGRIAVEAVHVAPNACARIIGLSEGHPRGVTPPADTLGLVLSVDMPATACPPAPSVLRQSGEFAVPGAVRAVTLYVQQPNDRVLRTERIAITR